MKFGEWFPYNVGMSHPEGNVRVKIDCGVPVFPGDYSAKSVNWNNNDLTRYCVEVVPSAATPPVVSAAAPDGWVEWNGGKCPVAADVMVEVRYRKGGQYHISTQSNAECYSWTHDNFDGNIVAYRVLPVAIGVVVPPAAVEPVKATSVSAAAMKVADMVNNPPHYQLLPGVEVYDVRVAMLGKIPKSTPYDQVSDWDRATEYLLRMWQKNGLEDAKKARWYLNKLIEKMT